MRRVPVGGAIRTRGWSDSHQSTTDGTRLGEWPAGLRAALVAGRNGGTWDAASGIVSAAVGAAPAGTRTLGYTVAADGSGGPPIRYDALMRSVKRVSIILGVAVAAASCSEAVVAQPPMLRRHTANRVRPLALVPADREPPSVSRVSITIDGDTRVITSNDIPSHRVGRFPNRGNPHAISEQTWEIRLPAKPSAAAVPTMLHDPDRRGPPMPFGLGVNGVLFDPGAAEYWMGNRQSGWTYEALGGAVALGLDANHAHVQAGGLYHYHGLPTGLLADLGFDAITTNHQGHSPLIGWAADGFPIYCLFGYADADDPQSGTVKLTSSYRLKQGQRPGDGRGPGGRYDGAFVQDYEYVAGAGLLDACNGRTCVTPEFPAGTYAYFLTEEWPVIPRAFRGTPVVLKGPPRRPPDRGRRP